MAKRKGNGGTIRVSMPAEVASDLDSFKKGVMRFAEEIGCDACFSGYSCTFEGEREFVLDGNLKLRKTEWPESIARSAGAGGDKGFTVAMSLNREFDLDWILGTIDRIGGRLGEHGAGVFCCSGYDMRFDNELWMLDDGAGNFTRDIR